MQKALQLARKGYGATSPNPMVGAVLVKRGKIIGRGWHRRAGEPHAEIEAFRDAQKHGHSAKGSTLYVTLEPCCTHGRTPPCTDAIITAGIKRVIISTSDPNPKHNGKAFRILKRAGVEAVSPGTQGTEGRELAAECSQLNEAFNHWIVHRTPFVTVKAAMTLDGKIATATGESKWITSEIARDYAMNLRHGADAILVGVNTILADGPRLTIRGQRAKHLRRIVLDSMARTPLTANVVADEFAYLTTVVVSERAPKKRVAALTKRANVVTAPGHQPRGRDSQFQIDLRWLLKRLGKEGVTHLLVEGGGEVNASFLLGGFAQRVAFFYAPKVIGGRNSLRGVAGDGVPALSEVVQLADVEWKRLGPDLLLLGHVQRKRR